MAQTSNGPTEGDMVPLRELSGAGADPGERSALLMTEPGEGKVVVKDRTFQVVPAIVIGHEVDSTPQRSDVNEEQGDDVKRHGDSQPLASNDELDSPYSQHMELYADDLHERGKISQIINRIANYQGGVEPNIEQTKDQPKQAKLGTLLGVYLPTIQNIFGVLLFIRMTWIVGMAGALEGLGIVAISCCTTMLTAISMSAIATNGVVPAGGSYFMISRSLGPEFGGAVGILFYLGTSVASSMYIIGAVEILVKYMARSMSIFGDVDIEANAFNAYRVYGTAVLIILSIIVFIGVKFVSKFAALSLACVILSIFCIYIGIFVSNEDNSLQICLLGDRLLTSQVSNTNGTFMCIMNETANIFKSYCTMGPNDTHKCEPYFDSHTTRVLPGIPGLASGVFYENLNNRYTRQNKIIGYDIDGDRSQGEIIADVTSSFMVLLAIYFPSCTGIMAGSNRSGDLADASKSIPVGTIAAIATTSFVCILLSAPTISSQHVYFVHIFYIIPIVPNLFTLDLKSTCEVTLLC